VVDGRLHIVTMTGAADFRSGSEKWHIPDAGTKNWRKIAGGGQSSPYRTHALGADNTRAEQDRPGGLTLDHLGLKPGIWLTEPVTAP
jgi:hypothetical protein